MCDCHYVSFYSRDLNLGLPKPGMKITITPLGAGGRHVWASHSSQEITSHLVGQTLMSRLSKAKMALEMALKVGNCLAGHIFLRLQKLLLLFERINTPAPILSLFFSFLQIWGFFMFIEISALSAHGSNLWIELSTHFAYLYVVRGLYLRINMKLTLAEKKVTIL